MKTLLKTAAPFQVKALDEAARTFEGLASTWDLDLGGDVIHKGAFARTLDNWKASGGRRVIPLIDQHRYSSTFDVLGKLVSAEETDEGLVAKFEVVPGDDGDRLLARLRGGFVNGLSIGYEAGRYDFEDMDRADGVKERVRHLREVKLYEVSAVIWGMNPGALVDPSSVKALLGGLSPEEKAELRALLTEPAPAPAEAPAPATEGLAPDDPKRLQMEELLRDIQLRTLVA